MTASRLQSRHGFSAQGEALQAEPSMEQLTKVADKINAVH
jgi:hypothetical protein